jgi:1,6-anhydro-N-acetylmuramate kinase
MPMSPRARKTAKVAAKVAIRALGVYAGIKAAKEREAREKALAAQVAEIRELAWIIAQGQRVRSRPAASKPGGSLRISDSGLRAAATGSPPGPPNPPRPPADRPVG